MWRRNELAWCLEIREPFENVSGVIIRCSGPEEVGAEELDVSWREKCGRAVGALASLLSGDSCGQILFPCWMQGLVISAVGGQSFLFNPVEPFLA